MSRSPFLPFLLVFWAASSFLGVFACHIPIDLGPDRVLCPGDTIVFDLTTHPYSPNFVWSDGTPGPVFAVTQPGVYTVTSTDGCGSAMIRVFDAAAVPDFLLDEYVLCKGDSILVGPYLGEMTYAWSNGDTAMRTILREPGSYAVTVSNGCFYRVESIEIVEETPPVSSVVSDTSYCAGKPLEVLLGPANIRTYWTDGYRGINRTISEPGIYQVYVSNACRALFEFEVQDAGPCPCEPLVPNVFTPNSDGIGDEFLPRLDCQPDDYLLQIVDRWGNPVFISKMPQQGWDGQNRSQSCPEGVYYYSLVSRTNGEQINRSGAITLMR